MRLTDAAFFRLSAEAEGNPAALAVLWALWIYGCIVNDRTSDVGHSMRLPSGTELNLNMRLTDFEVLI